MSQTDKKRNNLGKGARWIALVTVSLTMMFGYFFTDVMAPLEELLTRSQEAGGLGWTSDEYGFFSGSYGFFNVFLLLIFFGGIILDKFGIRMTGTMSTLLMLAGALIKYWAVSRSFDGSLTLPFGIGTYSMQVIWACVGFALFGVGCEIAGITVSKIIVKWFNGHELALAMGLQVAVARLGTALALSVSLPLAQRMGGVSSAVGLGTVLLLIGLIFYLVYCVMDKRQDEATPDGTDEAFHFADLRILFTNRGFWLITLLCLMFYAGVFPFLKFATKIMITKYGVSEGLAGLIPAMLPFGTIILTPLFGGYYDRKGMGATLMLLGSMLLTLVHLLFAAPMGYWMIAIASMLLLGISFGLVPAAMWPAVPKIIPMKLLGTAYALIFYIQNIGLSLVPILIGKVNQANTDAQGTIDYTMTMIVFAAFGVMAVILSLRLKHVDRKEGYGLEEPNIKQ